MIRLTSAGEAAMRDADRIRVEIETRWRDQIGAEGFATLDSALRQVIALAPQPGLPGTPQSGKKA